MALHYTRLEQLTAHYGHIVVSPHLDDAALSCGGRIAALAAAGEPVLVVNVCSGSPGPGTSFSPFAEATHARWGLPAAEAVRLRLAEDEQALETLGADSYQLDLLDAIYRMPAAYTDNATLFGAVAPGDGLAAELSAHLGALAARFPAAIFYAPLGVGGHVDHQAAYAAALALAAGGASVAFYEDFPYVARAGALEARLAELGGAELFMPVVASIDGALQRKAGAIEAYASQLGALFGAKEEVAPAVAAYAAQVRPDGSAYGERIWVRR
ncbi:MAG TPA: PIG-L family deacetylase [Chloroflexaceae bacterium]|nr:PIG-L family deacetylase [Chloroflexaceae bacterium]